MSYDLYDPRPGPSQPIDMVRGSTTKLHIEIRTEDGSLYEPPTGAFLRFGIKKEATDTACVINKKITSATNGAYTVTLSMNDTKDLECGDYCYDAAVESGDGFYAVIPCSRFTIHPNAVR